MERPDDSLADNIRELLNPLIGLTVLDVTQDDWDEVCATYPDPADRDTCIYLHFSNGETLGIKVMGRAGFAYPCDPGV